MWPIQYKQFISAMVIYIFIIKTANFICFFQHLSVPDSDVPPRRTLVSMGCAISMSMSAYVLHVIWQHCGLNALSEHVHVHTAETTVTVWSS